MRGAEHERRTGCTQMGRVELRQPQTHPGVLAQGEEPVHDEDDHDQLEIVCQRRRLAIVQALAVRPDVLIADESVSALDVSVQATILDLFTSLQRELGLSVLFIAHNLAVVQHLSQRIAVMYVGRIHEIVDTAELFAHPRHPHTRADRLDSPDVRGWQERRDRTQRETAQPVRCPVRLQVPPAVSLRDGCPPQHRP
ncbi:hypothetical protein ACFVY0_35630 [Streptomyces sp. NPDC058286]|uniref:hypothetical protein n=1 Tax=Streptomyces sp. NPDC058286 TaxID=3346422 RepID=UPI0036E2C6CC